VEPMKALYSGALVTATRKDERTRHRRPIWVRDCIVVCFRTLAHRPPFYIYICPTSDPLALPCLRISYSGSRLVSEVLVRIAITWAFKFL
jgi:hypothetical protein